MHQQKKMEPAVQDKIVKRMISVANAMMMEALWILQDTKASGVEKLEAEVEFHQARKLYERATAAKVGLRMDEIRDEGRNSDGVN